jgi:hypothetical protein
LLDLDHASTIRSRAAKVLPPRGLSLPRRQGVQGRDGARDGSDVAAAPSILLVQT